MIPANVTAALVTATALGFSIWKQLPASWTAMQIFGVCFLAIGFLFWTIAHFQLGNSFTVTAQAKQLVTRGIYSKIRNPIYLFGSFVIAGLILAFGRPALLLVFVAIIPLQIWRARKESSVLEATFGEDYRRYRAATWF